MIVKSLLDQVIVKSLLGHVIVKSLLDHVIGKGLRAYWAVSHACDSLEPIGPCDR